VLTPASHAFTASLKRSRANSAGVWSAANWSGTFGLGFLERRKMADTAIDDLLFEADGLCSLIYHRERRALSPQTQEDLKQLCDKLRSVTKAIERDRRG
jgi:hypothetical protein